MNKLDLYRVLTYIVVYGYIAAIFVCLLGAIYLFPYHTIILMLIVILFSLLDGL